jgi:hypothetical protein
MIKQIKQALAGGMEPARMDSCVVNMGKSSHIFWLTKNGTILVLCEKRTKINSCYCI